MKNPFRYLWEKYAYLQAYLDDSVLYTTKKLQEKSKNQEDVSTKPLWKKILHYTGVWLSKSVWEAFTGFYETYAELKKWDNLAQTTMEEDLQRIRLKAKLLKEKKAKLDAKLANIEKPSFENDDKIEVE